MNAASASVAAGIAERLADSHAAETPVRIVGSGTWLDGGRPVSFEHAVHTRESAGVVEYIPGDLVITVGAGTTLEEIAAITMKHNQWLALDPFGSDAGTIGATVATGSSGPLASGVGRVRDLTLGLSMLSADGSAIRAGGRVVKNVAGFDLVRLATGAFGTLGVITEVSLRLHARPAVDETIGVALDADVDHELGEVKLPPLGTSALSFLAMEIVSSHALGSGGPSSGTSAFTLLARTAGNRERARAQRAMLEPLGRVTELSNDVWRAVRRMDGTDTAVARVTDAPARLGATLYAVQRALGVAGVYNAALCATPAAGRVRVVIPAEHGASGGVHKAVDALRTIGSSVLWERLPADCWELVPPAATDAISLRIRDAFDRNHTLNRGIFGPMGGHA